VSGPNLDGYVEVNERIAAFAEKYPEGSLQGSYTVETWGKQTFIVFVAKAFRKPTDNAPGIGHAAEPFPGKTSFTKDSELMNAETSAWGRALAALGFEVKRGVASKEEVEARQGPTTRNAASPTTPASKKQRDYAEKLLKDSSLSDDAKHAVWKWGQAGGTTLCKPRASEIIEALKEGQTGELLGKAGYSELPADTEGLQVDTSDFEDDGKVAPDQGQQFVEASRPDDE
jgi:hypothetical protein